jgi:hypothetical protein
MGWAMVNYSECSPEQWAAFLLQLEQMASAHPGTFHKKIPQHIMSYGS